MLAATSRLASRASRLTPHCRLMATAQSAILNRDMGSCQWYLHLSRTDGADMAVVKKSIADLRAACAAEGVNLVLGFGPTLLADLSPKGGVPDDFKPYEGYQYPNGEREAKATQEELLVWVNHNDKGKIWKAQYDLRMALEGHMKVARETPTFIYGDSLDMTGFQDGTGNPSPPEMDKPVAIVPDGAKGEGGSFLIAQRWVHDLPKFNALPVAEQEGVFGRTKNGSVRLDNQPAHSHLSHVELRDGATADASKPKRDEARIRYHATPRSTTALCPQRLPLSYPTSTANPTHTHTHALTHTDDASLDAVRLPRRHGRPLFHWILCDAGPAAGEDEGDVRHGRAGARQADGVLQPGVGLLLLCTVGRGAQRALKLLPTGKRWNGSGGGEIYIS